MSPDDLADMRQRDHTDGRALSDPNYEVIRSEVVQAIRDRRALLAERTEIREAAQEFVDGLRLIGQNSSLQMSNETRKAIGALFALKLVDLLEPYWKRAGALPPPPEPKT